MQWHRSPLLYIRSSTEPHTNPEPKATSRHRLPSRTMPLWRASWNAMGSEAEAMLPYSTTLMKTFSWGKLVCSMMVSSIRKLA